MSESSQLALKVVVIVHFVLSVWASMYFLNAAYIYMSAFILAFGVWAIISPESVDAVLMFFILNVVSIVMDAVFIGVFESMRIVLPEVSSLDANTFRFCLGMSILNLILKPLTSYILYRLYQDRKGENSFPQFNIGGRTQHGEYDPIGASPSAPYNYVETAAPHSTIEKTSSS